MSKPKVNEYIFQSVKYFIRPITAVGRSLTFTLGILKMYVPTILLLYLFVFLRLMKNKSHFDKNASTKVSIGVYYN